MVGEPGGKGPPAAASTAGPGCGGDAWPWPETRGEWASGEGGQSHAPTCPSSGVSLPPCAYRQALLLFIIYAYDRNYQQ